MQNLPMAEQGRYRLHSDRPLLDTSLLNIPLDSRIHQLARDIHSCNHTYVPFPVQQRRRMSRPCHPQIDTERDPRRIRRCRYRCLRCLSWTPFQHRTPDNFDPLSWNRGLRDPHTRSLCTCASNCTNLRWSSWRTVLSDSSSKNDLKRSIPRSRRSIQPHSFVYSNIRSRLKR